MIRARELPIIHEGHDTTTYHLLLKIQKNTLTLLSEQSLTKQKDICGLNLDTNKSSQAAAAIRKSSLSSFCETEL